MKKAEYDARLTVIHEAWAKAQKKACKARDKAYDKADKAWAKARNDLDAEFAKREGCKSHNVIGFLIPTSYEEYLTLTDEQKFQLYEITKKPQQTAMRQDA